MLDRRTAIIVSLIWVLLIFVVVGLGIDDDLKNMGRAAWNNWESPISLESGSTAIKSYSFPDDPTIDAPIVGRGPTKGQYLVESSLSPDNSYSGMQKAYVTADKDGKMFLFVLIVKPEMTISKSWKYLGSYSSISNVMWVENQDGINDDQLIFIAGTKVCTALPKNETFECH